uniref:Uncharacterized protein n=1 Tax=viral metagenome TaxID=1070528 RepID=A0A6C0EQB9_9ZZZZ
MSTLNAEPELISFQEWGKTEPEISPTQRETLKEAESKEVQTEAVETESKEAQTEAVETEAVETEAVETEAVETEAVETEAVETEAVETKPWFAVSEQYVILVNDRPRFYTSTEEEAIETIWKLINYVRRLHPDWKYYTVRAEENELHLTRTYNFWITQYEEIVYYFRWQKIEQIKFKDCEGNEKNVHSH